MSTESVAAEEDVRLGVFSTRPFGRIVSIFVAIGVGLGVAGFLVGWSGEGGISREALGMMMLGIIPFVGVVIVGLLGLQVGERTPDALSAAVTVGTAGLVGHILLFMLAMPFVMAQPIDPPIPEETMMNIWLRGTAATVLTGILVAIVGNRVEL